MDEFTIRELEVGDKTLPRLSKTPIILLCLIGMIIAPISVYDDNWLNENIDTDDFWGTIMEQNVYLSLDTFQMEICADGDCEIEENEKLAELYQLCYDEVTEEERWNEVDDDEVEEMCGPWNDLDKAGKTTKTLIFTSMFLVFAGILVSLLPISTQYRLMPYSIITVGGGTMLAAIFNWKRMLPEFTENLDNGSGQGIAISSGILFLVAGVIGIIQSRKLIKQELQIHNEALSEE